MHLFETISTSALSQAFGWTLFHSLWQGLIWVLALSLILRFVSRQKAQFRYVASLVCLIGLFAGSLGTFAYEYQLLTSSNSPLSIAEEAMVVAPFAGIQEASSPGFFETIRLSIESWGSYLPYVSMIWLFGVLFFSLKWLGSWMYIKDIRKNSTEAKFKWQNWVDELAYDMNIRRYVGLRESSQIQSPMVIGHLKPLILLPVGMLTGLSTIQLEAILAHELAHIRRYDFLVNLMQSMMEIIFFYHPAQWWISNQVRDEREHCCDDSAVNVCGNPLAYAKALADLEEIRINQVQLAPALSGRKSHLLNRIQRLLNPELMEKPRETRVYILSLLILGFSAIFLVNPGYTKDKVEILVQGIVAEFNENEKEHIEPIVALVPLASVNRRVAPVLAPKAIDPIMRAPEPPMLMQLNEFVSLQKGLQFSVVALIDTPPPPPPMPPVPPVAPVPVPDMSGMPLPPTPPMPPVPMIGSFDRDDSVAMQKFELQMEKFGKEMEVWGEKYGKQMEAYGKEMEIWSKSMEKDWEKWEKEYEADFGKWEETYGKDWEKWGEEFGKKWEKWAEENEGEYENLNEEEREKLKKELKKMKEQEHRLHEQERRHFHQEQEHRMDEVRAELRQVQNEARLQRTEARRLAVEQKRELMREHVEEERLAQIEMQRAHVEMEKAHIEMERAVIEEKRAKKVRGLLVGQLRKDGLISTSKGRIKINIDGEEMKVNGKKLTDAQYKKYTKLLRENGFDITPRGKTRYTFNWTED